MKSYRFMAGLRGQLLVLLMIITLVPLILLSWVSYFSAQGALSEQSINQLISVRETKRSELETYFATIRSQMLSLSESNMTIEAMNDLATGFDLAGTMQESDEYSKQLNAYYQEQFLPLLNENLTTPVTADAFIPNNARTVNLQHFFISRNPNAIGEKDEMLTSPLAPPEYATAHRDYHAFFRNFLDRFGYYDIFLVDTDGNIVYSVFKEIDFGTNLMTGPYRNTNFAEAFRQANAAGDHAYVKLVDFEPYIPSYNAPASFIASPIFDGDDHVGVLIFQMPIDRLNNIMTNFGNWEGMGLGESGEVYLVGEDSLMRSIGRDLKADNDVIAEHLGTTILQRRIETEGTAAAQRGEIDVFTYDNYHGESVLGAVSPVDIEDLSWSLVAEINHDEAFNALDIMGQRMIGLTGFVAALAIVIAIWMTNLLSKPFVVFGDYVARLADGDTSIEPPATDTQGPLADAMIGLAHLQEYLVRKTAEADALAVGDSAEITLDSDQDALGHALTRVAARVEGQPVTIAQSASTTDPATIEELKRLLGKLSNVNGKVHS